MARNAPPVDTGFISIKEFAELTGIHRHSIERMIKSGDLPEPVRFSERILRFDITELETIFNCKIDRQVLLRMRRASKRSRANA